MTGAERDELRALLDAITRLPWAWRGNASTHHLHLRSLTNWLPTVMDFARWGMQGAKVRFPDPPREEGGGLMRDAVLVPSEPYNAWNIVDIDHPNARYLVAAANAVPGLLDALEGCEELLRRLEWRGWRDDLRVVCSLCDRTPDEGHAAGCRLAAVLDKGEG